MVNQVSEAVQDGLLCRETNVSGQPTPAALQLVSDAIAFDTLALSYVLEEPFVSQCMSAGIRAANVSVVGEATWDDTLRRLDADLIKIEQHPLLQLAVSAEDVLKAARSGRMAVMLATQDAGMIGPNFWRLSLLHRLGIRSLGLSYTSSNDFADGCGEPRNAGLTFLGKEFIAAVNELPMILDLSHVGHRSREEALELADWPACTHANAYSLNANDRNIKDAIAIGVTQKGGVISVCGLPQTVQAEAPSLEDLLDHIEYFCRLVGYEKVGIGLDLNEGFRGTTAIPPASVRWRTLRPDIFGTVEDFHHARYPRGLETITDLPNIAQGLLDRGWEGSLITGVLGGNWLNFVRQAVDNRQSTPQATNPKVSENSAASSVVAQVSQ